MCLFGKFCLRNTRAPTYHILTVQGLQFISQDSNLWWQVCQMLWTKSSADRPILLFVFRSDLGFIQCNPCVLTHGCTSARYLNLLKTRESSIPLIGFEAMLLSWCVIFTISIQFLCQFSVHSLVFSITVSPTIAQCWSSQQPNGGGHNHLRWGFTYQPLTFTEPPRTLAPETHHVIID